MRRDFCFFVRTVAVIPMRKTFGFNDHFCVFASLFWLGIITFFIIIVSKWRFNIRMIAYTHKFLIARPSILLKYFQILSIKKKIKNFNNNVSPSFPFLFIFLIFDMYNHNNIY